MKVEGIDLLPCQRTPVSFPHIFTCTEPKNTNGAVADILKFLRSAMDSANGFSLA
jgi:hypothetical protein